MALSSFRWLLACWKECVETTDSLYEWLIKATCRPPQVKCGWCKLDLIVIRWAHHRVLLVCLCSCAMLPSRIRVFNSVAVSIMKHNVLNPQGDKTMPGNTGVIVWENLVGFIRWGACRSATSKMQSLHVRPNDDSGGSPCRFDGMCTLDVFLIPRAFLVLWLHQIFASTVWNPQTDQSTPRTISVPSSTLSVLLV